MKRIIAPIIVALSINCCMYSMEKMQILPQQSSSEETSPNLTDKEALFFLSSMLKYPKKLFQDDTLYDVFCLGTPDFDFESGKLGSFYRFPVKKSNINDFFKNIGQLSKPYPKVKLETIRKLHEIFYKLQTQTIPELEKIKSKSLEKIKSFERINKLFNIPTKKEKKVYNEALHKIKYFKKEAEEEAFNREKNIEAFSEIAKTLKNFFKVVDAKK